MANSKEWTCSLHTILNRGWSEPEIEQHLGDGKEIEYKGRRLTVWPQAEVERAERTSLAEARRVQKEEHARLQAVAQTRSVARAWEGLRNIPPTPRAILLMSEWINAADRVDLASWKPSPSHSYKTNQVDPKDDEAPDVSKLIYMWGVHGTYRPELKSMKSVRVSWRNEDGPQVVAILRSLNILPRTIDNPRRVPFNGEVFAMEISTEAAMRLYEHGDCTLELDSYLD